jgi:hypothetical protein
MDPHQAELVTVVSHAEDGRILQYVKQLVPLTEADRMKAAARLRAEEKKAATLLKDTDGWLEKAHAPAPERKPAAPAARPAPQQQRTAPRAPAVMARAEGDPVDGVAPVRDVLAPARAVAKRKQQLAAARKKQAEVVAEAKALILAKTKEAATVSGKAIGRAVMTNLIERVPPGHMAANVDKSLDEIMHRSLQHLRDQEWYPTVSYPEFGETFAKSFWVAANEAVTEYNDKPKPKTCQLEQ